MKPQKALFLLLVLGSLGLSGLSALAQDGLVISEFLAVNSATLKDDFGEYSDYVELYNGSTNAVNLNGYYLTDNLANKTQWSFPAVTLQVGQHLLVWASGRDRKIVGSPLHTNFKLNGGGEDLALIKPNGTDVVHSYTFGQQTADRSYGLAVEVIKDTPIIQLGALASYLIPTNNVLSNKWTFADFDDTGWSSGATGVGFDTNTASVLAPYIATDVRSQMIGGTTKRSSLFLRVPFTLADPNAIANPVLSVRYDDGFIAFLNGKEIGRRGIATNSASTFSLTALISRTNSNVIIPDELASISLSTGLIAGKNVLAIHGANKAISDTDFLVEPELVSRSLRYLVDAERYFLTPTPGVANAAGFAGVSGDVQFSVKSTTYFNPFELTLTTDSASVGSVIRYTLNGTVPGTNSPIYTAPFTITNSVLVRARAFEPGFLPGALHSEGYARLNPALASVSSDMPLILIHTLGAKPASGAPGPFSDQNEKIPAYYYIFETVHGRSSFTNGPDMVFRAGTDLHGSSTRGNPKWNLAVSAWDELNENTAVSVLGMPPASTWIFHAPFGFDPSLFHNPLSTEMSQDAGRYAPRYRFAEAYISNTTTNVTTKEYFGVYNVLERISIGKDRVDIPKIKASETNEFEISGGYLMSIDRSKATDQGFSAAGQSINYLDPDFPQISLPEFDPHEKWLTAYMNAFGKALDSKGWTNPVTGYLPYIDRGAWIDHHLIMVASFNVDALRLSAYFYKQRGGPLVFGPVWDFDRAFGSTDGRDEDPTVWKSQTGDGGTDFFNYPWWGRMFQDPNFWQAYIDRWQELREGPYSNPAFFALMDQLNDKVKEAAPRDFARWQNQKRGGSQATELAYFKNWIQRRFAFMDGNFLAKPRFSLASGQVTTGTQITLTGPVGATIYYTLDGTDPRALHGAIDPKAQVYTGPITITGETRLVARSRNLSHKNLTGGGNPPISSPWSGPRSARFILDAPAVEGDLIVSELNYNPAGPSASEAAALPGVTGEFFEFVELKNVSNHRVDFYGARFTQGIDFTFGDGSIYTLDPNASLLIVRDKDGFALRYGAKPNIAGNYLGALNDSGDTIHLKSQDGQSLISFTYNDSWYPTTDGFGFTLVRGDTSIPDGNKAGWGASSKAGGSPGQDDPAGPAIPPVVINEILAATTPPSLDTVELLNRSGAPADISGWYLTDDRSSPFKYRIPKGTILQSGGVWTVDENGFNASTQGTNAFQLSSRGDGIWLFAADTSGNLLGYAHGTSFGASDPGTTFGRYIISTGKELFVAQKGATLGALNGQPKVGPIVIREIMYHPTDLLLNGRYWNDDAREFIEIQNIDTAPVTFYDSTTDSKWHLRGNVDFNFPSTFTLAPNAVALLVGFDPVASPGLLAEFKSRYSLADGVQILGPFKGVLNNGQGDIHISKPGSQDSDGNVAYIVVDQVDYSDAAPWPSGADGAGASLQRKAATIFGNDPASWIAARPTPGSTPTGGAAPTITQPPVSKTVVGGTFATLGAAAQGTGPLLYQWRHNGVSVPGANTSQLTLNPVQLDDAGDYTLLVVDQNGSVESSPATLTVLQPATIVQQPEGKNVKPGTNVTFSVFAVGTGAIRYQWYYKGKAISGATGTDLTLTNVQLGDSGPYTVVATDSIGSMTSDPAVLNVLVRPTFLSQPQTLVAVVGDNVQFEVELSGLQPFGYKWRRNSVAITGQTNAVFRINNVQTNNAANYSVNVTNLATGTGGTNSANATLIVLTDGDKDGIGDAWEVENGYNPNDASDALRDDDGDGANTLAEFLAGTNPHDRTSVLRIESLNVLSNRTDIGFLAHTNRGYTVQFREGVNRGVWQNVAQVPGRTNERPVTVSDTFPQTDVRIFRIVAPQQFPATSAGPTILASASSLTVDEGTPASFDVVASSDSAISYQWYKGLTLLPTQTGASLSFNSVNASDSGSYSVVATDEAGSVTNGPALLTVLQPPVITQQPASQSINVGATLVLSAKATGVGPLSYQWFHNEKLIPGATADSLTLSGVSLNDAGAYRVAVKVTTSNGVLRRSSDTAQVRVNE